MLIQKKWFQTILNELRSIGITIDKILRSMSRRWGPQVTTLKVLKNLDMMSLEKLVRNLKVDEIEFQQVAGILESKESSIIQGILI